MKLLDNSCISLFILEVPEYNFLNELYELNQSLNITTYVKNEFEKTGNIEKLEGYLSGDMVNLEDINFDLKLKRRYPNLGDGELSIIQWGLNLRGHCSYYCILDDSKARNIAKRLNLSISGSIGLIIFLRDKNNYPMTKIDEIIKAIDKSNFSISKSILNKLRE